MIKREAFYSKRTNNRKFEAKINIEKPKEHRKKWKFGPKIKKNLRKKTKIWTKNQKHRKKQKFGPKTKKKNIEKTKKNNISELSRSTAQSKSSEILVFLFFCFFWYSRCFFGFWSKFLFFSMFFLVFGPKFVFFHVFFVFGPNFCVFHLFWFLLQIFVFFKVSLVFINKLL